VLVGVQAHDELQGVLPPLLAAALNLPYVGVIRGVKADAQGGAVSACKEFPGAVMSQMKVKLPAVLGILAAEQPPRYVPVSRIRAAMKATQFESCAVAAPAITPGLRIKRLSPPASGQRAEILQGSETEIAARIVGLLAGKGLVK
jgi:electron transfer flavoprotein beta subunit